MPRSHKVALSDTELQAINAYRQQQGLPPLEEERTKKIRSIALSDEAYEGLKKQATHFGLVYQSTPNVSAFVEAVGLQKFLISEIPR